MNTTELLAVCRQEVFDLELPYLWSDALLYAYIDDAQKQFCRDTYGIEDSRSFKLAVKDDGTIWYALDPLILKIRDAIDSATGKPVDLVAMEKMDEKRMRFDGLVGPLKAFITGMDKGYVRAYPIPSVAATVELRVFRLPNDVAAGDDFEIDAQHVLNLLFWVKYRAYSVQDAETSDKTKAASNKALWDAYAARAKVEQSRLRRPVSAVTYGGI
jgi:hypothetical protein